MGIQTDLAYMFSKINKGSHLQENYWLVFVANDKM